MTTMPSSGNAPSSITGPVGSSSRRTVLKTAAWSVPVIAATIAVPAAAASQGQPGPVLFGSVGESTSGIVLTNTGGAAVTDVTFQFYTGFYLPPSVNTPWAINGVASSRLLVVAEKKYYAVVTLTLSIPAGESIVLSVDWLPQVAAGQAWIPADRVKDLTVTYDLGTGAVKASADGQSVLTAPSVIPG